MSTTWKVVIAVVAVAVIGGVIYYFATKKPSDPSKVNLPTNAPKTTSGTRTETGKPEAANA